MNAAGAPDDAAPEAPVAPRDWVLLPVMSVLTVFVLLLANQLLIWWKFPYSASAGEDCLLKDATAGARGRPGSVCSEWVPEGGHVVYRFDRNGYRNESQLGPKSAQAYRIVMVGTSTAAGFRVSAEKTMASLLPIELTQRTGRKVELYNESLPGRNLQQIATLADEFVAGYPDLVLLILTPIDIWDSQPVAAATAAAAPPASEQLAPPPAPGLLSSVRQKIGNPHSSILLRHFLYEASPSLYVNASLRAGESDAGFLTKRMSAAWESAITQSAASIRELRDRVHAHGVDFVAVFVPNRSQVAMVALGKWPDEVAPYELGSRMRTLLSPNSSYIDLLPAMRGMRHPELGYFAVDVHPNAQGHRLFTRLIADQLAGGRISALHEPRAAAEH